MVFGAVVTVRVGMYGSRFSKESEQVEVFQELRMSVSLLFSMCNEFQVFG